MPPDLYNVTAPSSEADDTKYKNSKHSSITDEPDLNFTQKQHRNIYYSD